MGGRNALTEQQHFNLIALRQPVTLQLVLDLLVACLPILILCAHATTHLGWMCLLCRKPVLCGWLSVVDESRSGGVK
jgi:hypothetical protein